MICSCPKPNLPCPTSPHPNIDVGTHPPGSSLCGAAVDAGWDGSATMRMENPLPAPAATHNGSCPPAAKRSRGAIRSGASGSALVLSAPPDHPTGPASAVATARTSPVTATSCPAPSATWGSSLSSAFAAATAAWISSSFFLSAATARACRAAAAASAASSFVRLRTPTSFLDPGRTNAEQASCPCSLDPPANNCSVIIAPVWHPPCSPVCTPLSAAASGLAHQLAAVRS